MSEDTKLISALKQLACRFHIGAIAVTVGADHDGHKKGDMINAAIARVPTIGNGTRTDLMVMEGHIDAKEGKTILYDQLVGDDAKIKFAEVVDVVTFIATVSFLLKEYNCRASARLDIDESNCIAIYGEEGGRHYTLSAKAQLIDAVIKDLPDNGNFTYVRKRPTHLSITVKTD